MDSQTALTIDIQDEAAMLVLGERLANITRGRGVLYLYGDLGAGKTTLARGLLRGLGYVGAIKSPTFTLVEPYEFEDFCVFHFDLYRLQDAEELEFMGIRDYFLPESLSLIEWPEKGENMLPIPDLHIRIVYAEQTRELKVQAFSARGASYCTELSKEYV